MWIASEPDGANIAAVLVFMRVIVEVNTSMEDSMEPQCGQNGIIRENTTFKTLISSFTTLQRGYMAK